MRVSFLGGGVSALALAAGLFWSGGTAAGETGQDYRRVL